MDLGILCLETAYVRRMRKDKALSTVLPFLTHLGNLHNTVCQDPLHNKRLNLNWLTFYILYCVHGLLVRF
jgi:hypothetical protein